MFLELPKVNYACGGDMKVDPQYAPSSEDFQCVHGPPTVSPIVLRWDGHKESRKIQFPPASGAAGVADVAVSSLAELLSDCAPATFGHGDKDVLDENYRKAAKLDNTQFSTNFHPHDSGIIAAISQTLLPSIVQPDIGAGNTTIEHWGLTAELYKLNIYSAPSGKFKAHVDTPRGPTQFGSLVVCLPYPHQGGQLQIRHHGEQMLYDWGNDDANTVSWAAFYSDCEHEVFEVTSGHRITLTYNLYISEHLGSIMQSFPTADPKMYPAYKKMEQALKDPAFLSKGGTLGFPCVHQYAHNNTKYMRRLPYALKGTDAVIYTVFQRGLALRVSFRPILNSIDDESLSNYEFDDEYDEDGNKISYPEGFVRVGDRLHGIKMDNSGDYEDHDSNGFSYIDHAWPHEKRRDIQWISGYRTKPNEIAFVTLAYGNEYSLEWHYSSLAMLIKVPSYSKRIGSSADDVVDEMKVDASAQGTLPEAA